MATFTKPYKLKLVERTADAKSKSGLKILKKWAPKFVFRMRGISVGVTILTFLCDSTKMDEIGQQPRLLPL